MSSGEKEALKLFGKTVASLRRHRGLTQEQLAEITDLSLPTIAAIERGLRWPRLGTLRRIAKALHVPSSELLRRL